MKPGITSAEHETLKLDCPYCAGSVEVPRNQLSDGLDLPCPHCHEEVTLISNRAGHPDQAPWRLIQLELDDERR